MPKLSKGTLLKKNKKKETKWMHVAMYSES